MATSYSVIYEKAISLINSYKITSAIKDNPITFYRVMYPFLQSAFGRITTPSDLIIYLQYRKEPEYIVEDFIGEVGKSSFELSFQVETEYIDDVYFNVEINDGVKIEDVDYNYNASNNSINFSDAPEIGAKIVVEYYYVGAILGTSDNNVNVCLTDYSTQLIASHVVLSWIEKQKNRELMIQANISPKDYQLYSPANAIKENKDLYKIAYDIVQSEQKDLGWTQKILKAKYGSGYNMVAIVKRK